MEIDSRINQANGRLKAGNVRVRIEAIGKRLYLQATLPPKPDSKATRAFQQRIALGVSASPSGVSLAEKEARKVGALLDCQQFDWMPYLATKHQKPETVADWLTRFEYEVEPTVAAITWETDYRDPFKRLDPDAPLTLEILEDAINATKPDSRTRKRVCNAFGRLARLAGLEIDFRAVQGSYSATQVDPRSLPTDEEIANFWHKITNPGWKWVYGVIATFGLRPHEAFFLDVADLRAAGETITVLDGGTRKRRPRQVWAYYPEWVDGFNLREKVLPQVTGERNSDYGDRVTHYLRNRAKMPFVPYDLRHCWARRAVVFGLPDALAAKQMGHSLTVHHQTYQAWIDERTHQQVHETLKARGDRPLPPSNQSDALKA